MFPKSSPPQTTPQTSDLGGAIRIDDSQTRDYIFHQVHAGKDLFDALKLVQDIYIQEGYVDKQCATGPCRVLKHHYHDKTAVFVGKKKETVVFTVSLFPDTSWGLPMDVIFRKELDRLRSQGRYIGEVSCLATHPDHRTGTQVIPMYGNKILLKYATEKENLDDLVIAVHPKHARVYTELLLFEELAPGSIKPYPGVNNSPAVALRMDLSLVREKYRACYENAPIETNLYHFLFNRICPNIEIFDTPPQPVSYDQYLDFFPASKAP